jgi:hypothetical protein
MVNLRPESDWPRRFRVAADLPRVVAILRRIAYDVHELARSRRVADLDQAAVAEDPRAERRRRVAEPALEFIAFCREAIGHLRELARKHHVTLLTATHDVDHGQAAVLAEWFDGN